MRSDDAGTSSDTTRARLTAETLLGENTVDTLATLVARLSSSTGLDLRFDGTARTRTSDDRAAWRNDLVWACGLLTVRTLEGGGAAADVVAAPVFAGESAACYHSVIVARPETGLRSAADVARARVAINEFASWSGCHALLAHLSDAGHPPDFAAVTRSGSHRRSVATLAAGRADAAAVDHTVWHHLLRTEPATARGLVVVERTASWPAPPFTLSRALPDGVRERLLAGLLAVRADDVPGLERVERCDAERYRPLLERAAAQSGIERALRLRAG